MQKTLKLKLTSILLLIVLLVALLPLNAIASRIALASESGTVTVHFYTGDNVYEYESWGGQSNVTWGAWFWVDSGRLAASSGKDPVFAYGDNVGQKYSLQLTASETRALKEGKSLGLVMVRSYIDDTGTYQPLWNNNEGRDLASDRYFAVNFNSSNKYEVWIIAGDKNVYTTLADAKEAFESIQSARFDDFNNIYVKSTTAVTTDTTYKIYAVSDRIANAQGTLVASGTVSKVTSEDGLNSKIYIDKPDNEWTDVFGWNSDYMLYLGNYVKPLVIDKSRLYLSKQFEDTCVPTVVDGLANIALGSTYTSSATVFRLWAPISTNVYVNLYKSGDVADSRLYAQAVPMKMTGSGVWEATVSGDLDGVYYTYTNYVADCVYEICDPYATATGVNGNRAMVCNLDATDPAGWENDLSLAQDIRQNNSLVPVIWEIHIRDFSIAADSGLKYKGKYLAFTEQNTTAKGSDTVKTGISYLKDLGVTYVHLNPVYDFATVDEQRTVETDYATKQNWGYDPKNYNVPEGSYATNAEDGHVRINEFKQMVMALHEAGIGVIMDVVYNHTFSMDGVFEQSVPGYYYRQALGSGTGTFGKQAWSVNSAGNYNMGNATGCGNETASERAMYRSYMVNSVLYWATEYHIDGFRFDLMAVHDVATMNYIRQALNTKVPGGTGILMYGEPWAAAGVQLDGAYGANASKDNINQLADGIKAFNDTVRDAMRGNNSLSAGFVNGNGATDLLNNLVTGIYGGWVGGAQLDAADSIIYASAHDNYTIWDQLVATTISNPTPTMFSQGNSLVVRRNMMSAAITLMGKGTSFILAGEEIARTKYGNHNSYNAQDQVNEFDYYRQEQFADLYSWYKSLIQLRTQLFTTAARPDANANIGVYNVTADVGTQAGANNQTLSIYYKRHAECADDQYSEVMIMCNAGATSSSISFSDSWYLIADSSTGIFNFDSTTTVGNGNIVIPPYTTYIIVKK